MVFTLLISSLSLNFGSEALAANMKPVPGSPGWKSHVDGVNNDWHVHVEKGKFKEAERVTGGTSHKKT